MLMPSLTPKNSIVPSVASWIQASDGSNGVSCGTYDFGNFGAMHIKPSGATRLSSFVSIVAVVSVAGLGSGVHIE